MSYLGEFEQLILFSVVELRNEAYGGAIRESIERRTGRVVSSGAINTALSRLAERGLVTSRVGEPTAGRAGRPRKYFALRPAGARALKDSYSTMQAMAGGLLPRLTKLAEGKQ
jgi:DNA-binding PadR family transcriptional regulator